MQRYSTSDFASIGVAGGVLAGAGLHGPGSNGFLRREMYRRPGTYSWVARRAGDILIQALGAAAGGSRKIVGPSAAFGEKRLTVAAGDTLTLVLGAGGLGKDTNVRGENGGATSISGAPVGGTPLVLVGALGPKDDITDYGTEGTATGPWDLWHPGAKGVQIQRGSPSSGSPFGPGFANSDGSGGAGWGGPAFNSAGASSHHPCVSGEIGARGILSKGGHYGNTYARRESDGETQPWWDLRDVDSGGGAPGYNQSGGSGGPGAGGGSLGSTGVAPGTSTIGGGTGYGMDYNCQNVRSGHGAGGCACGTSIAGAGGHALILIFSDGVV